MAARKYRILRSPFMWSAAFIGMGLHYVSFDSFLWPLVLGCVIALSFAGGVHVALSDQQEGQ